MRSFTAPPKLHALIPKPQLRLPTRTTQTVPISRIIPLVIVGSLEVYSLIRGYWKVWESHEVPDWEDSLLVVAFLIFTGSAFGMNLMALDLATLLSLIRSQFIRVLTYRVQGSGFRGAVGALL